MSLFFYNLGIQFYGLAIRLAVPFKSKAAAFRKGRKNWRERISKIDPKEPLAWFHCASLGEFEQGRPLIEEFRHNFPDYKILLTFFSPSGFEVRKDYEGADFVEYLPLDTKTNAINFLNATSPNIAIFVKYEIWHHYYTSLVKLEIPFAIISAIFRPGQIYFKKYGKFNANILRKANHIFTQDLFSKDLLSGIGIQNASVAGDTRFDRVKKILIESEENTIVQDFVTNHPVFIIGSSWPEDLSVLIPFIKTNTHNFKFIVAPHEINQGQIDKFLSEISGQGIRYTECSNGYSGDHDLMIIDTIGILSQLYKYGHYAYIGGAFGNGLHNILEAATFGMPIFFGKKNYNKFREARDLIELQAAFPIENSTHFKEVFEEISSEEKRTEISQQIKEYMQSNTGATDHILKQISSWVK